MAGDNARIALTTTSGTWTSVRYDAQPAAPINGTIALTLNAHRSRATSAPADRDFSATVTMTFGAAPTISLDGTHTYAIDMSSGAIARM